MIWRRLQIPGETTLAQLHKIIQIAYGWEDDYLHQFHIYGRDYGTHNRHGFYHAYGANEVCLNDLEFDTGDKFYYKYNFFEHWVVDVRIEKIAVMATQKPLCCLTGKGVHGVTKDDEMDSMFHLIESIAKADEQTTTMGDILPYVQAVEAMQFNRSDINRALQMAFG